MHGSATASPGSQATASEQPGLTPISISVPAMAKLCGISVRYAWWLVHSEQIASFPLGSRRLVRYEDAKAWFDGVASGAIVPRQYGRLTAVAGA